MVTKYRGSIDSFTYVRTYKCIIPVLYNEPRVYNRESTDTILTEVL